MKKTLIASLALASSVVIVAGCLTGCSSSGSQNQMVGNDRDEHGCIASAGYSWCEAKQQCIREWEEPCE